MIHFTLQFLMLLSGWRFRPVFFSVNCLICAVELLSCLKVCKLEPLFKIIPSFSRSLFSAWIFKNISHWRSIRLTLQPQPTKRYASSAGSRETSLSPLLSRRPGWGRAGRGGTGTIVEEEPPPQTMWRLQTEERKAKRGREVVRAAVRINSEK